jgi:exportin-7
LLNESNVQVFAEDFDSSIALLTLLRQLFTNRNMRLTGESTQLVLYQFYSRMIDYFLAFCKHLIAQQRESLHPNKFK